MQESRRACRDLYGHAPSISAVLRIWSTGQCAGLRCLYTHVAPSTGLHLPCSVCCKHPGHRIPADTQTHTHTCLHPKKSPESHPEVPFSGKPSLKPSQQEPRHGCPVTMASMCCSGHHSVLECECLKKDRVFTQRSQWLSGDSTHSPWKIL